jgi:hypothetical protein
MTPKEKLFETFKKYEKLLKTPYLDKDSIEKMVSQLDNFANNMNPRPAIAFGMKVAAGEEEEYITEYMASEGITPVTTEEEHRNRALAGVSEGLTHMHRTIQQDFMRIVLGFIELLAAMGEAGDGWYDLRNEQAVKLAMAMWNAVKDRDDLVLPRF